MNKKKHTEGKWELCGGYSPEFTAIKSKDGYQFAEQARELLVTLNAGQP